MTARLTKKMIAAREAAVASGDFSRKDFEWAMDAGLTFAIHVRELTDQPVIAEREGIKLISVGSGSTKELVGPEYPWLPFDGLVRAWLINYDGPELPVITMAGVSGPASSPT